MTFQNIFELWFSFNDSSIESVTQDTLTTKLPRRTTLTIEKVDIGMNEFLILPESAVILSHHPHLFGFFKEGIKLLSRYFWMSRSEGCWRAGTGFRPETDPGKGAPFGAFTKGQEHLVPGGYTFESQLHFLLQQKLDSLFQARPKESVAEIGKPEFVALVDELTSFDMTKGGPKYKKDKIKRFLIKPPETDSKPAPVPEECIVRIYEKEVTYVEALDPALHDAKIIGTGKRDKDGVLDAKGVTSLQMKAAYVQHGDKDKSGLKAFKDAESPLWRTIGTCLDCPTGVKYKYFSQLLESDVNVEVFRLQKAGKIKEAVDIEIAYTTRSFHMKFMNKAQSATYEINSPVCWVKSVYIDGGISNFGNYKKYPWDLCFLPQKPMDYYQQPHQQVSDYLIARQSQQSRDHSYTFLALFDEKYCPLIQKFKMNRHFPLFKSSYITRTIEKLLQDWSHADMVEGLRLSIMASCREYVWFNQNNPSWTHGQTGQLRAEAFKKAVSQCNSFKELNKVTYTLFAENKVGNTCYTTWYGGGKIGTRSSSYLVFFCDALLILLNSVDPNYWIPVTDKRLKGEEHCITRAVFYLKNNGIPVHPTDSATLEGVLEAMKSKV